MSNVNNVLGTRTLVRAMCNVNNVLGTRTLVRAESGKKVAIVGTKVPIPKRNGTRTLVRAMRLLNKKLRLSKL